jgi:hypothetical protein
MSLDPQGRAGFVASEFSLVGNGAATLVCAALVAAFRGSEAAYAVRPAVAAGAGLVTAGLCVVVMGRWLDLGATKRESGAFATSFPAFASVAVLLAAAGWIALHLLATFEADHGAKMAAGDEPFGHGPGLTVLAAASAGLGLPLLGLMALRALAAVPGGVSMPFALLNETLARAMLTGLALVTLIALVSEAASAELAAALVATLIVGSGFGLLWAVWLLLGARRVVVRARDSGMRVPSLERGYFLAAASVLVGLVVPGMLLLTNLIAGRDTGTLAACAAMVAGQHAMRYAFAALPLARFPPRTVGNRP